MKKAKLCPKCSYHHYVKHGRVGNKQRYLCKSCGYKFSVFKMGKCIEKHYVVRAIQLYLEGLGFRSIERYLGVSHVSVMNWVKQLGGTIELIRQSHKEVSIAEVDELCSYVGEKKTTYGSGLLLTGLEKRCLVLRSGTEVKKVENNYFHN